MRTTASDVAICRYRLSRVEYDRAVEAGAFEPDAKLAERRGALAVRAHRTVQLVEHVGSEGAVVAEALSTFRAVSPSASLVLALAAAERHDLDAESTSTVSTRRGLHASSV